MRCTECQSDNAPGSRFCSQCSAKLPATITCPSCRAEIIEGARFCPICSKRLEGGAKSADQEEGDGEKKASGTNSSNFCHVCHEPTPATQLTLDHEGHHVCRKCMISGAAPKDPKLRALETLKQQLEAQATTRIKHLTSTKGGALLPRSLPEPPPRKSRSILLPMLLVFVVLAGGAAAGGYYYFNVYLKAQAGGGGSPDDSPGAQSGGGEAERPARIFVGTFAGVPPEGSEHAGELSFESETGERIFVEVPENFRGQIRNFVKGRKYRVKFRPDASFEASRLIAFASLAEGEGIREVKEPPK